ncbi:MAG: hypothetical protein JWP95_461 [Actinotalea sp.]|nr:hypothetical protein [Actinotalea sp.]
MTRSEPRKTIGMRFTERFLLPFLGPAQLGHQDRGKPATAADRERNESLRTGLTRVIGPDGRAFLVERRDEGTPPQV